MNVPAVRWPMWWPYAVVVALMAPLTVYWWAMIINGSVAFDWRIFVEAGHRFWAGSPDLYEVNDVYSFRHSPLFAMAMPAIAWIGTLGIRALTVAAALALPTWPMRLLALASWPFAMDLQHGALITFLVLAAAWGLRGSRVGGIGFIVLTLLSPRPLMLPVAGYLLWRQHSLRLPALGLLVAAALGVTLTGYAGQWVGMLASSGLDMYGTPLNLSPSRFIGSWWIPLGALIAIWLTVRGRPGFAALAINPYVLPHYLLFALLELRPHGQHHPMADGNDETEGA